MKHEDIEEALAVIRKDYDGLTFDADRTLVRTLLLELAALRERGRCETAAVRDVTAERRRQTEAEGWTIEHDDEHTDGELAGAAAAYCIVSLREVEGLAGIAFRLWPWEPEQFKPCDTRRRELVKAGALILAEIERLDRLPLPEAPR